MSWFIQVENLDGLIIQKQEYHSYSCAKNDYENISRAPDYNGIKLIEDKDHITKLKVEFGCCEKMVVLFE